MYGGHAETARRHAVAIGLDWHVGHLPDGADIERAWAHWEAKHPAMTEQGRFEFRNKVAFITTHWRQCMGVW